MTLRRFYKIKININKIVKFCNSHHVTFWEHWARMVNIQTADINIDLA